MLFYCILFEEFLPLKLLFFTFVFMIRGGYQNPLNFTQNLTVVDVFRNLKKKTVTYENVVLNISYFKIYSF